jgi:RND family efflux transporter MFP subunit
MTGRRRVTSTLGLAALAAIALACKKGGGASATPPDQAVTLSPENVAVVAQATLRSGPEVSGTLRARREATLRAEVGGAVLDVTAEAGQRVKPNQLLGRIDDTALQNSLLAARAGVSAAKNGVQVAEANARRARTLAEAGAVSAQQAEQAEAALEGARAQLADAEARLTLAAQQAAKAHVRAPFAGVVAQRQVSAGDVVAPGAPLFTVIDPARLQFEAAIPAARVGEARPGAEVVFHVTGFEERFQGELERVAPAVDAATGQVRVYVDVPNRDGRLLSGLYAQGRVAAREERSLAVSVDAVDMASTPPTVLRVANGKVEKVAVELGLRDEPTGLVAVTSGLQPGDVLVLGSARGSLAEGAPVRLAQQSVGRRPPAKTD